MYIHWTLRKTILVVVGILFVLGGLYAHVGTVGQVMHQSLGFIVMVLAVWLWWRHFIDRRHSAKKHTLFEQVMRHVVWRLFLITLFFEGITGWFMMGALGYPASLFGVVHWAAPVTPSAWAGGFFYACHQMMGLFLITLFIMMLAAYGIQWWRVRRKEKKSSDALINPEAHHD